jgi:hypothetical protein
MMSLAGAISGSLAIYLRHPLVQKGLGERDGFRESGMSYPEKRTHLSDKVTRFIIRESLALFNDPSSYLYEAPLVMFYDDPEGEAWRGLAHVYKRSCLQAAAVGEIPLASAYLLVRRNLSASVMGKRTDRGRSQRMSQLIANTLTWSKENSLPQLSSSLSRLSKGLSVVMTQCALAEALRLARRLTPPLPAPDVSPDPGLPHWFLPSFQLIGESDLEITETASSHVWSLGRASIGMDLWTARRLQGRVYGLESSVGYSYVPLIQVIQASPFVSVGCGHGAGPAVLLAGGSPMCYGLDLRQDITAEARMTGQHTPLHIARLGFSARFLRLGWANGWSGDIRSPQSIPLLRSTLGRGLAWVCDIPLKELDDLRRMIWNIVTVDPLALLAVRLIGSYSKVTSACTFLSSYAPSVSWHPVYQNDGYAEGWICASCNGNTSHPLRLVTQLPGDTYLLPLFNELSFLGGGKDYILEMATGGLYPCTPEELVVSIKQLETMIGAATGEIEHRFTYRQWTDVLGAMVSIRVISDPTPFDLIKDILESDSVTLTLGPRIIPKIVDLGLRRLLTRVVSRAL